VSGTVEKDPVSPFAIAGCYLFASPATFLEVLLGIAPSAEYTELYVSGVYNTLLSAELDILFHD
jgi:hypothetical protein